MRSTLACQLTGEFANKPKSVHQIGEKLNDESLREGKDSGEIVRLPGEEENARQPAHGQEPAHEQGPTGEHHLHLVSQLHDQGTSLVVSCSGTLPPNWLSRRASFCLHRT